MKCRYSIVCFDVDSTLVTIEGVDLLASGNEEVARLTDRAMSGELPIEEVYARRLDMIRPDRPSLERLSNRYLDSVVTGVRDVFETLRSLGTLIHLVTGGLEPAVAPLADSLGVPRHRLHAVRVMFDETGSYEDFDRRSPLARSGGKETIVTDLRLRSKGKIAFIGDGVTDLETRGVVDLFIGFGGVRIREAVRKGAEVFVDAQDMRAILPYLVDEDA